jgi:predicted Zn-dependent protease
MVAFAEVTSFVRFFATTSSPDALPHLLLGLRQGKAPDAALKEASGSDLKQWDSKWRAYIAAKPKETLPALFELGTDVPNMKDLRERVRLAELLLGRGHAAEALLELDHIKAPSLDDPSVRYVRARALVDAGRGKEADPLLGDPKEVVASYGPWWAIRGSMARSRGDGPTADSSFVEAVAADPLEIECACQSPDPKADLPSDPGLRLLCEAARARGEPSLGAD